MIKVFALIQKVNKQKKEIVNRKQQKLVHFLEIKTKIHQKTIKKSLETFLQQGLLHLQDSIRTSIRIFIPIIHI